MIPKSPARSLAIEQLLRIDPLEYGRSRNYLNGAVTRLSPFIRHGVLSLAELRDAAIRKAGGASACLKFLQELAWRDYYQRIWRLLGSDIWSDLEPYKTGLNARDYAEQLPADLLHARTGIDYIDHFVNQLHTTGYLHNHARMWLAAYVVHGRRVQWQAGARWFLSHLLDGDEASNNLSWQWCASTFSHKPYIYNRQNVLKFSSHGFAEHQHNDPFDTDYETLAQTLFPQSAHPPETSPRKFDLRVDADAPKPVSPTDPARTLVWVHDAMMSPAHPAIAMGNTHIFIWDDARIAALNYSPGRLAFQRSALFCPDLHSQGRSVAAVLLDIARDGRFQTIVTGDTPDPRLLRTITQLQPSIHVQVVPHPPFAVLTGQLDLTRFSRYWSKAQHALGA